MHRALKLAILVAFALFGLASILLTFFSWQAHRRESKSANEVAPATGRFVNAGDTAVFSIEAQQKFNDALIQFLDANRN